MSLELLNRRDDVVWRALARGTGVSEALARALWVRAEQEAANDPVKAEQAFRRMLDEAKAFGTMAGDLDSADGGLLDPGKWTRVLDLQRGNGVGPRSDIDASALDPATRLRQAFEKLVSKSETVAQSITASDGDTIRDALQKFRNGQVGTALATVDGGGLEQLLRVADALISIVEHDRDVRAGKPLPTNLRAELEHKLGVDFSDVRVHDDAKAAREASSVDAVAFARGKDVYFADGAFDPSSTEGKKLIAHEVAHVAQQRGNGAAARGAMSEPGSAVEREADRVANAFASGAEPGAAAFRVRESAAAGTISRKTEGAGGAEGGAATKWNPKLLGQVLELGSHLAGAKDVGDGKKEIKVNQNLGPLRIQRAQFKVNGDKVESGTLFAKLDSGVFKGTEGQLTVDANEGVTGKLTIPVNAPNLLSITDISVDVGAGEISTKVRLKPDFKASKHFAVKDTDFEVTVTSKGGALELAVLGHTAVEIKNGFAEGAGQLDLDLKADKDGVSFNAHVKGKISVAGLAEADATIFYNGEKLELTAGGKVPIAIPGLEGSANIKYELGKLSLDSEDVRFTWPKLRPVAFKSVALGGESNLKASLHLDKAISVDLPGGATVALEESTIKIDGKKVEGSITGSFALNNADGFKAKATIGYAEEGGFTGNVTVEGGASFTVGGFKATVKEGSKLDISKTEAGFDFAGDISANVKLPGLADVDARVIAANGKPLDLTVDANVEMQDIQEHLRGKLHVKYARESGNDAFALEATNVGVELDRLKGKPIFSSVTGTYKNKKVTASLVAAQGTEIAVSEGSTVTINSGQINLKDKKLDGYLDAKGTSNGSEVKATIGWKDGTFDWAAEGNFELGPLTKQVLLGNVRAAASSRGVGNFVSNGPINFGNEKLKDITIEHVEGNKEENKYTATISAEKAINKTLAKVPDVEVNAADVRAKVTYDDGKLSVQGKLEVSAKYPKTGEPELAGTLRLSIDENNEFHGELHSITVKKGDYFEAHGGTVDLTTGDVDPGPNAKFEIPSVAKGTINSATFNIHSKQFRADIDVSPTAPALKGIEFNIKATNDTFTAKLREDTPPIKLGDFAQATISSESTVEIKKQSEGGINGRFVGSVDAKNVGRGTFALDYKQGQTLKGGAKVTVDPFAMFDKIDIDVSVTGRQVSTNDPVVVQLQQKYQDKFVANATINVKDNKFDVQGEVKEIKNLGAVSDAFKAGGGAKVEWDKAKGVRVHAGIAMEKVIPQLARGSLLTLDYAAGLFTIEGTLKPAKYGPVAFSDDSHITARWTSQTNELVVHGDCTANIANLCEAKMTVAANAGGDRPGEFYLDGSIDATALSAKVPGVTFSSVIAKFGVAIGAGRAADLNFGLTAFVTKIADYKVGAILAANYKTGEGFGGMLQVTRAELGPVIADGFIAIEKNKFKGGSLHMMADFPSLKIEGMADVKPGEMGGLDTKVDLKVTPAKTSAIAEFVDSGSIHVDIQKWKVTNAEGTLNLVPPSFLPLVDPKIVVSYKPELGIKACLKTQFVAPMAKNNEMGNFEAGYEQGRGLYAHVDFPLTVPGFQATTVYGDLDSDGAKVGVKLIPKNDALVKQATVELGYTKGVGFYIEGKIRLKPTESLELEVGLRYDGKGLQVIGMEPDDKDANEDEHEVAKFKKAISVPLASVGVASLGLKFGLEVGAGYRMPKIKFKNPKLEGGLDALDSGGMPSFTFGGSIAMGAYVKLALSVQIVGEIELLIASASAGIGAEISARLNLEMGADVNGRYASGQGALIEIDPYVGASLDLVASLIATLYAEIGWWTILDKKWTLASATLAHIELGRFQPFQPVGLAFGGPGGTRLTRGLTLREDAFGKVEEGVKEGGQKAADAESNREAREKITPVLQAFKNAAPLFQELPEGWEKGMVAAPVSFNSMFPVEDKHWDFYQDHADQAEDMVPELRMSSPTERLAKAVAVTARRDPMGAGRLILGWRRAQIAAKGINPDTGVNVIEERAIVQALIEEKYQKDLAEAQQKQKDLDAEHAGQVTKQGSDFAKAETAHAQVGVQQKVAHEQNVNKIQTEWDKAQEKKAEAGKVAEQEGAEVKPANQEKAPPPPKPAAPPMPKPLGKPAPIPVPTPIPLPPPAEVLPAVTLPALPADPGVNVKAAAVIPPSKKKAEPQSPGKKEAPGGGAPNPTPGAAANTASQTAGGGGSPLPTGDGEKGGAAKAGGSTTATPPPGPQVAAGPDGIISQNKTIDAKHKQFDPAFKGAGKPGMLGALGGKDGPIAAFTPPAGGVQPKPGEPKAGGPPGAPGGGTDVANAGAPKPSQAPELDPTVQKVVDAGKAEQQQQKQQLDSQKQKYDASVKQQNKQTEAETKKLDAAAAEAKQKKEEEKEQEKEKAAAAETTDAPATPGDGKDTKPKSAIGIKVSLDILGESHTLYIDENTGVAMVASTPMPVSTKISEASSAVDSAPESVKQPASASVQSAQAAATTLDATAKKAHAGDEGAMTAVAGDQEALANPLKVTWAWLKVTADPAVTSGSIDKPLLHPHYPTFKGRVAQLSSTSHITTVDATQFAESIWTKICEAVKRASPLMNDPATYSNFANKWIDMSSPQFQAAIKEFEAIGRELAKVGTSAFSKASTFGFWSKDEGRSLAEAVSGLTLETSSVGTMMDGLPTLDGKKNGGDGWDPEIWGALSNAYANAVVPEVIKGKKINVCVGAGVPAGNIWDAVESVALEHGLKQAGITLESVTTHYAAAPLSKKNRRELDPTKLANGIPGCLFVGERAGAIAAADANFTGVPDEPVAGVAPDPAANAAAAVGTRVPMTVGTEPHTHFIDPATAKPMVASAPTPVTDKLAELNTKLGLLPATDPKRADAQAEVAKAQGLETKVAELATKVKQGNDQDPKPADHATSVAQLATEQDALAASVATIWTIADPAPLDVATAKQALDAIATDCVDISEPLAKEFDQKQRAELESKYIDKAVARHDIIAKYLQLTGDSMVATQKVNKDPITIQKFQDVDDEKHIDPAKGGDGKKKEFYDTVQAAMINDATFSDRAATFELIKKSLGYSFNFLGAKIPKERLSNAATRNQAVDNLFKIAITQPIDDAIEASLPPTLPAPERAKKKSDENLRKKTYRHMLVGKDAAFIKTTFNSSGNITDGYATWYGPGSITLDTNDSPNEQFAKMMTLGALQPEWYGNGTVVLNIQHTAETKTRECRKPTAFDGMLSALWVARNLDEADYGVTGGGLGEFLEMNVPWADVKEMTPVIPSDDFLAEIQRISDEAAKLNTTPTGELVKGGTAVQPQGEVKAAYDTIIETSTEEQNKAHQPSPVVPDAEQPTGVNSQTGAPLDRNQPSMAPGGVYDMTAGPRKDAAGTSPTTAAPSAPAPASPTADPSLASPSASAVAPASPSAPAPTSPSAPAPTSPTAAPPTATPPTATPPADAPLTTLPTPATPPNPIGSRVPIELGDESHTLYVDDAGTPTIASDPLPATQVVAGLGASITAAPAPVPAAATPGLQISQALIAELVSLAAKALAGDEQAHNELKVKQTMAAAPLRKTWKWKKVANDPALTTGALADPLKHPFYEQFKARVAKLTLAGQLTVDPLQFAPAAWTKICAAVKAASPSILNPNAYTDPDAFKQDLKGWVDMKSQHYLDAISQFDGICGEIAKASKSQFKKATSFGFWSGKEGRTMSEAVSGLTLETSAIGGLMDDLPTLNGKAAGWDPEIWGGLSKAYATAVGEELANGKNVNVCVGAEVKPGNIWDEVESKALEKGLALRRKTLEDVTTYYGAASKSLDKRWELDTTKTEGGITGCVYAGKDRSAALGAADDHLNKLKAAKAADTIAPAAPTPVAANTVAPNPSALPGGPQTTLPHAASTVNLPQPGGAQSAQPAGAQPAGAQPAAPALPAAANTVALAGAQLQPAGAQPAGAQPAQTPPEPTEEQKLEELIDGELKDLENKKFVGVTSWVTLRGLLIDLGAFEDALNGKPWVSAQKYPVNVKVGHGRKFIADKRYGLDASGRAFAESVKEKALASKTDPAAYRELEKLKEVVTSWKGVYEKEPDHSCSLALEACVDAFLEITKAQDRVLAARDTALTTAKTSIDGIDTKDPKAATDALRMAADKVSLWLDDAGLPVLPDEKNLRAAVDVAREHKAKAIETAKQAPPPAAAPPAPAAPDAAPVQGAVPAAPTTAAPTTAASPTTDAPEAAAPAVAPGPSEQEQAEAKQLFLELEKKKLVEKLKAQLKARFFESMHKWEYLNTAISAGLAGIQVLTDWIDPAVGVRVTIVNSAFFYAAKWHKHAQLLSNLEALEQLDAASLRDLEASFDDSATYKTLILDIKDALESSLKRAESKVKAGAAAAFEDEKMGLGVAVVDLGTGITQLIAAGMGAKAVEDIASAGNKLSAVAGLAVAIKDLRDNFQNAATARMELAGAEADLESVRKALASMSSGGAAPATPPGAPPAPAGKSTAPVPMPPAAETISPVAAMPAAAGAVALDMAELQKPWPEFPKNIPKPAKPTAPLPKPDPAALATPLPQAANTVALPAMDAPPTAPAAAPEAAPGANAAPAASSTPAAPTATATTSLPAGNALPQAATTIALGPEGLPQAATTIGLPSPDGAKKDPTTPQQQPPQPPEPPPPDPAPIAAMSASYTEIGGEQVQLKIDPAAGNVTANAAPVTQHSDSRPAKEISDGIKAMVAKYLAKETNPEERKALVVKIRSELEALRSAMAFARGEEKPLVQMRVGFEKHIGAKIFAEADGFTGAKSAVDKMVLAALKILAANEGVVVPAAESADAIVKQMAADPTVDKKKLEEDLGIPIDIGFAGAAGKSFKAITNALTNGSLTERSVHLIKFGEDYLGKQLLMKAPAVMERIRANLTDVQKAELDKKIEAGKPKIGTDKEGKASKSLMTDVTPPKPGTDGFQMVVDSDGPMDDKTSAVPLESVDRAALVRLAKQKDVQVEPNDTTDVLLAKLKAATVDGKPKIGPTTNAQMTADPDKPGLTKEDKPYQQGIEANLVLRDHPWIKGAREAEMPLKAGISGTTHRFLGLGQLLGVEDRPGMRLAMLGHLQAIEAHSFHEICDAVGMGPPAGQYLPFAPVQEPSMRAAAQELIEKDPANAEKLTGLTDIAKQVERILFGSKKA